ncbi:MAG: vWA domain-containing protein [Polyangiaceae bacterium]
MNKFIAIAPLGLLAFGCGSNGSDMEFTLGNGNGGTSIGVGQGGSTIGVGSGNGGATGVAGNGTITGSTLDDLKKMSCQGWSSEPESLPSLLQFVVDTSGSMDDMTASTMGQTKWERTRAALLTSLDGLPASIGLGMLFYPNMDTARSPTAQAVTACVRTDALIPIALLGAAGSAQRTRIAAGINGITPRSYTPTYDAYTSGVTLGLLPSTLPGKRFMVLITDGAPTLAQGCVMPGGGQGRNATPVDPAPIVAAIQTAHDQNVQTFVIGSPGSEESINGTDARVAWLSKAARAGGTDTPGCSDTGPNFCHIDLTQSTDFASALSQSLAKIAGAVVQCSYPLPQPGSGQTLDLSAINVVYTAGSGTQTLLARSNEATCSDGWHLVGSQVELCDNTCSQVKADSKAGLELMFGCSSVTQVK